MTIAQLLSYIRDLDHKKTTIAGAIPKLKKSDRESNSIPKSELVLKSLANFPSILSRKEARTISETDISHFWSIANFIEVRPQVRDMNVKRLGIKLLSDNFFILIIY